MESEADPIVPRPRLVSEDSGRPQISVAVSHPHPSPTGQPQQPQPKARFTRQELNTILHVYGRKVATGEWRDYAIDFGKERATFSVFRRASEMPLYRIEKTPKLARKQGAYSVVTQTGLILKRGHDLRRVLTAIDKQLRLID